MEKLTLHSRNQQENFTLAFIIPLEQILVRLNGTTSEDFEERVTLRMDASSEIVSAFKIMGAFLEKKGMDFSVFTLEPSHCGHISASLQRILR